MIAPWQSPAASWSVLVEAPTEEPITLAMGKLLAGLAWPVTDPPDPRDDLMTGWIAAARDKVERDTGLALLTQTRDVYFTTIAAGLVQLPGQALPIQEVISVTPMNSATWVALGAPLPPGAWEIVTEDGVTTLAASALDGIGAAIARLKVGWTDRAALKTAAPMLVHAVGLLTAHFATAGRDAVVTGTIAAKNPIGYDEAIAPYCRVWVP